MSLSKTLSLKGINHIDNINLYWGSGHLFGADGLHPIRSGVKVPMDHFWFSLQHPSARPPIVQPDTHQTRPIKTEHHSLCVSVLTTSSWISVLIPPPLTFPLPLPHPFWDSLTKWKSWLMVALNSAHGHCRIHKKADKPSCVSHHWSDTINVPNSLAILSTN